jgi:hypothetical protein
LKQLAVAHEAQAAQHQRLRRQHECPVGISSQATSACAIPADKPRRSIGHPRHRARERRICEAGSLA